MENLKVRLVDFEDSFTFNIVELFYRRGDCVTVVPWREFIQEDPSAVGEDDLLVLGPGPGNVLDYAEVLNLLKDFKFKHVLGICLGHQLLGSALGFQCRPLKEPLHGRSLWLEGLGNKLQIGDLNAQFYNSWSLFSCEGLEDNHLEKISEHEMIVYFKAFRWLGVQFHPESVGTSCPNDILEALLEKLYNDSHESYERNAIHGAIR